MDSHRHSGYFLLVLIAASVVLAVQIFMPFLAPLALAAAFATVLQPLHLRFLKQLPGHSGIAATLTLITSAICILVPLVLILSLVGWEASKLYASLADGTFTLNTSTLVREVQHVLPPDTFGTDFSDAFAGNVSTYAREMLSWLSGHVGDAFSSVASLLLNLFVFFIALFFFLRDGDSIRHSIIALSPLHDRDDRLIFDRLEIAVNSVIRGNLLIALIRGIAAAVGFFVFGIPNPVLWGIVAGLAGLIPGIGIIIVFTPAIMYAYFTGGVFPALALLVWGTLVVGLIDNVLTPKFVGHGMRIHPLFVFLAIFGGIAYFGPVGVFLGPLSMSLLFALLSIYASPSKHTIE